MHAKSKEIVQPNAVYKTGAIKREFKNLIKYFQVCKLYEFIIKLVKNRVNVLAFKKRDRDWEGVGLDDCCR